MGGFISAIVVDLSDGDEQFGVRGFASYISDERSPRVQAAY